MRGPSGKPVARGCLRCKIIEPVVVLLFNYEVKMKKALLALILLAASWFGIIFVTITDCILTLPIMALIHFGGSKFIRMVTAHRLGAP